MYSVANDEWFFTGTAVTTVRTSNVPDGQFLTIKYAFSSHIKYKQTDYDQWKQMINIDWNLSSWSSELKM